MKVTFMGAGSTVFAKNVLGDIMLLDNTHDVERPVPDEYANKRVAYICVFDNAKWVPVHYGRITDGKVRFNLMGPDIVYMAALYEKGKIVGQIIICDKP